MDQPPEPAHRDRRADDGVDGRIPPVGPRDVDRRPRDQCDRDRVDAHEHAQTDVEQAEGDGGERPGGGAVRVGPRLAEPGRSRLDARRPVRFDVGDGGERMHRHRPAPPPDDGEQRRLARRDGRVRRGTGQDVEPVRQRVERRRRLQPERRGAVRHAEQEEAGEPRPRERRRQRDGNEHEQDAADHGGRHHSRPRVPNLAALFFRVLHVDVGVEHVVDAVEEDVRGNEEVREEHERRGGEQLGRRPRAVDDADGHRAGEVEPEPGARGLHQIPDAGVGHRERARSISSTVSWPLMRHMGTPMPGVVYEPVK
jgi:hypothetical protein